MTSRNDRGRCLKREEAPEEAAATRPRPLSPPPVSSSQHGGSASANVEEGGSGWDVALIVSEDLKQAIEAERLTGTRFIEV